MEDILVAVDALDNDVVGINMDETGNVVLREGGSEKSVFVTALNSEPAADVLIDSRIYPPEVANQLAILSPLPFIISKSDWENVMEHCSKIFKEFGINHDVRVISAHRTPKRLEKFMKL